MKDWKNYLRIFVTGYLVILVINLALVYQIRTTGQGHSYVYGIVSSTINAVIGAFGFYILNEFIFKKYFKWRKKPVRYFLMSLLLAIVYTSLAMLPETAAQLVVITHKMGFVIYYIHNTVVGIMVFMLYTVLSYGLSFLRQWKKSLDDNDRIRQEMLVSQFELLKNQVNPHFLYNSLNTLTTIIPTDPAKAVDFVAQLSRVFKYSLMYGGENTIEVSTELEIIEAYLFLNEQRFGGKLITDIRVDESVFKNHLITQAMLMLVENAIKHNEISKKKPLKLSIYNIDNKTIVVENTLQAKRLAEKSTQIGLSNIISRYKLITREPVVIEKDKGLFTVKIPILT